MSFSTSSRSIKRPGVDVFYLNNKKELNKLDNNEEKFTYNSFHDFKKVNVVRLGCPNSYSITQKDMKELFKLIKDIDSSIFNLSPDIESHYQYDRFFTSFEKGNKQSALGLWSEIFPKESVYLEKSFLMSEINPQKTVKNKRKM